MNKYQEAITAIKPNYSSNTILREALDLSIELLEKATPKKPVLHRFYADEKSIYHSYGFINVSVVCCPNCKEQEIYDFEYDEKFKYCTNCGQAIDWSAKEIK